MSLPNTLLHYEAELDVLDRAKDNPKGIRIEFPTYEEARLFRFRIHHARALCRVKNCEIYTKGDALYNASVYDNLTCRIKEGRDGIFWLYLEKNLTIQGNIQSLDDLQDEELAELPPKEQRRIEIYTPRTPLLIEPIKRRI